MTNLTAQSDAPAPIQAFLDHRVLDLPDRLLDLLPIGVYVCDREGLIVRYNRAAAELLGLIAENWRSNGSFLRLLSHVPRGRRLLAPRQMSYG